MRKDTLIDVFPRPLSNEEAIKYYGSFIKFDEQGRQDPATKHLLEFEKKYINFFILMTQSNLDNMYVVFDEVLINELEQKPWIKNSLTRIEFNDFLSLISREPSLKVENLNKKDLILIVKLACRELLFPCFVFTEGSIKACDDNVFLVTNYTSKFEKKLKVTVDGAALFLRDCIK